MLAYAAFALHATHETRTRLLHGPPGAGSLVLAALDPLVAIAMLAVAASVFMAAAMPAASKQRNTVFMPTSFSVAHRHTPNSPLSANFSRDCRRRVARSRIGRAVPATLLDAMGRVMR